MRRLVQVTFTLMRTGQILAECVEPPLQAQGSTLNEALSILREKLNETLVDEEPCLIKGRLLTEEFEN